jgi:hypothetical protein
MKAASLLLALVVVLGFVSEAGAIGQPIGEVEHDYTIELNDVQWIGFEDGGYLTIRPDGRQRFSYVWLGPLGRYSVPFTATQGLVGFCIILATLIFVPVVLSVRRRKRAIR